MGRAAWPSRLGVGKLTTGMSFDCPCKAIARPYNSEIPVIPEAVSCTVEGCSTWNQAGVAQLAEHDVANVVVVGSNPITRSSGVAESQSRSRSVVSVCRGEDSYTVEF